MINSALDIVGVVEATSRVLRERILSGTLAGDTAVTEAWVSAEFGIARPSAKAAIEQLVASGLLVRTAHRSARVAAIDAGMVRDVYRTRARMESMALRELATDARIPAAAIAANDEISAMPPRPDPATVDPDIRFHTALIDGIESERTSRMYRTLLDETRLCMAQVQDRRLLDAHDIAAQHRAILDAVRDRDGDLASRLLHEHLGSAEERLVEALSD
ncbi:GntR family transcriptional regulator [Microbacterium sp. NPDC089698]|uniref:GntR family transcriptional regulator n=1 Tax=Microbacterium sp. NPDC089698 TaxID=3364200 RepID=UPI00382051EE